MEEIDDIANVTEVISLLPIMVIVTGIAWFISLFRRKNDPVNNDDYIEWKKRNKWLYRI